jgi:predicted membrane protein
MRDYNVIIGKSKIDLSNILLTKKHTSIYINVIFGHAELLLDPSQQVYVEINSAFAGAASRQQY